jgi:rhodanese-related sulfurtransferase
MAGFVAENMLLGKTKVFYWNETGDLPENAVLLDVRTLEEFAHGQIPGALHIPVDDLRAHLNLLPAGKDIYVYCQSGLRAYLAQRILLQNGFERVFNLSGGYQLWDACTEERDAIQKQENAMAEFA